jgi:hypothetical protein
MSDQGESQSQPSIRDRIGAVLSPPKEQAPEPVEQEAPEVEAQEPEQVAPETETETPQPEAEEAAPDDWVEIEVNGKTLQVPQEFQKAFMQERDYTQKRQADADRARITEAREQGIQVREQALQALQPLFVQHATLNHTIQQYERLDWDTLRANDPVDFSTKRSDYAALLNQRRDLQQHIEQGHNFVSQKVREAEVAQIKAAEPLIRKAVPDWGPEKAAQLSKYAIDAGASPHELGFIEARAWAVPLLEKARKYDELQASKAQLPKKTFASSPTAKPGAKTTHQSSEAALYRKNIETFRQSKGKDGKSLRALIKAKLGT